MFKFTGLKKFGWGAVKFASNLVVGGGGRLLALTTSSKLGSTGKVAVEKITPGLVQGLVAFSLKHVENSAANRATSKSSYQPISDEETPNGDSDEIDQSIVNDEDQLPPNQEKQKDVIDKSDTHSENDAKIQIDDEGKQNTGESIQDTPSYKPKQSPYTPKDFLVDVLHIAVTMGTEVGLSYAADYLANSIPGGKVAQIAFRTVAPTFFAAVAGEVFTTLQQKIENRQPVPTAPKMSR